MGTTNAPEELNPMPPNGVWPAGTTGAAVGMWKVLSGEVEVWRDNLLIGIRKPGDYIGALGLLYKPPFAWTTDPGPHDQQLASFLHVRQDAHVEPLNARQLGQELAAGGDAAVRITKTFMAMADDFELRTSKAFNRLTDAQFPGVSHQTAPPPYRTDKATLYVLPCRIPQNVHELLPPFLNVRTNEDGSAGGILGVLRYQQQPQHHLELTQAWISIPVRESLPPHRIGHYVLWQFADNAQALLVGREIFGLPSMYGSLIVEGNDDERETRLIGAMGGQRVFDLHLKDGPNHGPVPALDQLTDLVADSLTRLHTPLEPRHKKAFAEAVRRLARLDPSRKEESDAIRKELCQALKPPKPRRAGQLTYWALTRISWDRTFQPSTPAAPTVQWDPSQFAADGLLPSWLGIRELHDIFIQRVVPQKDKPPAEFEFFVSGNHHTFQVLAEAAVVAKVSLVIPPGKRGRLGLDTDYAARVRNLVKNPGQLAKLTWGPEAWGAAASLPSRENMDVWKHGTRRSKLQLFVGNRVREPAGRYFDAILARLKSLPHDPNDPMNDGIVDLHAGQGILDYEFTDASCAFVESGELDVWQVERYGGTRVKGEFLHALRRGLPFEVTARTDARLRVFKLEDLWDSLDKARPWGEAEQKIAQLLGYSSTRSAIRTSSTISGATFQAFPGARAVVLPGPYKADRVTQINMPVLRSTELESLLPPRVTWYPGLPFALFFVAKFAGFGPQQPDLAEYIQGGAAYHECGLMIPTRVAGGLGMRLFVPWIFPTSLMAMFAGREIYGYPKTWATIDLDQDSLGAGRLLVRRNGVTMADVSYEPVPVATTAMNVMSRLMAPLVTACIPGPLKSIKVACHKRLWNGVARETDPWTWNPTYLSVDEIANSGFDIGLVKRLAPIQLTRDTIELNIAQADGTHAQTFSMQTLGGMATRVEYGMVMTPGKAPVNYLGPTTDLGAHERTRLAPEPSQVPPTLKTLLSGWYGGWKR